MLKNRKFKAALSILMALIMVCSIGIMSVSAEVEGTWSTLASMAGMRARHSLIQVYGSFYAIGGIDDFGNASNRVEWYNILAQCWTSRAPMITPRYDFAAVEVYGKIYVLGGKSIVNGNTVYYSTVESYDVNTNTWATECSMPVPLSGHSAAVVNGKIYIMGGAMSDVSSNCATYIFDPYSGIWSTGAPIPTPRANLSAVAINSDIYTIGGIGLNNQNPVVYGSVEVYNTLTDTWSTKAGMTNPRFSFGTAFVDGKIYTMGGKKYNYTNNTYEDTDLIETYYVGDNRWTSLPTMPSPRSMFGIAELDGKIYISGGYTPWGSSGTMESYIASPFTAPKSLTAKAGNGSVTLTWTAGNRATGYYVKRATTPGGPYTQLTSLDIPELTYTDTDVINGTTYYYIVTSAQIGRQGDSTPEVSATPGVQPPAASRAQLVVTLTNGTVRQYDLPMPEIQAFLDWYDAKSIGNAKSYYCINKYDDLGNFTAKRDYISFDKICIFEVNEY